MIRHFVTKGGQKLINPGKLFPQITGGLSTQSPGRKAGGVPGKVPPPICWDVGPLLRPPSQAPACPWGARQWTWSSCPHDPWAAEPMGQTAKRSR